MFKSIDIYGSISSANLEGLCLTSSVRMSGLSAANLWVWIDLLSKSWVRWNSVMFSGSVRRTSSSLGTLRFDKREISLPSNNIF
jgi:hypothetical protein